jgi:transcriptional regulator with XRE-family HTH domain
MRLKTLRKAAQLTQQTLADKVTVSRIYIQALESNRRMPSMKLLRRLSEALNVDPADLVQGLPEHRPSRMQLEEIVTGDPEVEVWYRSKKLSPKDLHLVQKLIEAALEEWDAGDALHQQD